MIYRKMYCGYGKNIRFIKNENIITASSVSYNDMVFVYYESSDRFLEIQDVVAGDMILFPNGEPWFRMTKVFQCFTPLSDSEYVRKIQNKEPKFRINFLEEDLAASYIHYHMNLQYTNQYDCDKYFSIFVYGNMAIIYNEEPRELVLWSEIEGREYRPCPENWGDLMEPHFKTWSNGKKGWIYLEDVKSVSYTIND